MSAELRAALEELAVIRHSAERQNGDGTWRPCQCVVHENARAALASTSIDGVSGTGLDVAWREAEAAVPEGWSNGPSLFGYDLFEGGRAYTATVIAPKPYKRAHQRTLIGDGSTPEAALRNLRAALAKDGDSGG